MSENRSLAEALFGIPAAQAKEPGAEDSGANAWGTPQQLAKTDLSVVTAAGARHDLTVEVARTEEEQAIGMMFRKSVASDTGMLFLFPRAKQASFWMRNTYVPLDLLFIDKHSRIVGIHADAEPESLDLIQSDRPVVAVLELAGGEAARRGLAVGDRVLHQDLPRR